MPLVNQSRQKTATPLKKPPQIPVVVTGTNLPPAWDLTQVPSSYLVAELIRRGECPRLQPSSKIRGSHAKG